ncbi:expressed unknown protein [Seminavis robusta]|uniref:PPPDE domain-containing protein n=1 Tax=Seminavis robusta TaxID=568900 RepID=A0A9N8HTB7_9STRA|nr:expressed unknown protein [Seminavis robusta]|eukprot:Sro1640_g287890.1 n/a (455) ;mRNA; f:250-1815
MDDTSKSPTKIVSLTSKDDSSATSSESDIQEPHPPSDPIMKGLSDTAKKTLSTESSYGHPLSAEEAAKRVPPGEDGLQWHATLINGDPFDTNGKLKKGLHPRDFDLETKTIRPRRASLPVLAKPFFASLTRVQDEPNGTSARFIFHGILNGWPSLQAFEVMRIERKRGIMSMVGLSEWVPVWDANEEGTRGIDPTLPDELVFRVTLRAPSHSTTGWSQESPGFVFWYQPILHTNNPQQQPTLTYGTQMVQDMVDPNPICTKVHMLGHRYERSGNENAFNRQTYHSLVLLEWDHQKYCTVVEKGFLNGLAGWNGKCLHYDDMDEPETQMYKCFPPEMVAPWLTDIAEIRCSDVEATSLEEFKAYLVKYEQCNKRFFDIQHTFSSHSAARQVSKKDIAEYLVNYIRGDPSYVVLNHNCQTFTADLCNFLAADEENTAKPIRPFFQFFYKNRTDLFL